MIHLKIMMVNNLWKKRIFSYFWACSNFFNFKKATNEMISRNHEMKLFYEILVQYIQIFRLLKECDNASSYRN